MSDVFDGIISKLKQKAKSGVNILEEVENSDFTIICRFLDNIDDCLGCRCSGCKWKEEKKWVRLEDVLKLLEQIKQNYILIEIGRLEAEVYTSTKYENLRDIVDDLYGNYDDVAREAYALGMKDLAKRLLKNV